MKWRIAGINFDHFHMGDLLRMVYEHPNAEIVGVADEQSQRMLSARQNFELKEKEVFTDYRQCLEQTKPDIVILCPAAARHAEWTEKVAPFGAHVLMEKPFASNLSEAERMVAAMDDSEKKLAINWPLAWHRSHQKTWTLIQDGLIGEVQEVHFYDGNRGPLWHGADKIEREPTEEEKKAGWFYRASEGGGSLQDYLGYGTTLGTWFNGGKKPIEVMAIWDLENSGLEVDEHCIAVARYESGLSKFETRWGTFTDPWSHQPQPKCGFIIKGTRGTISSGDYDDYVTVQLRECPEGRRVDAPTLPSPKSNPVEYLIDCLENEREVEGPLSVAMSLVGQQIVDTAFASAQQKRVMPLLGK